MAFLRPYDDMMQDYFEQFRNSESVEERFASAIEDGDVEDVEFILNNPEKFPINLNEVCGQDLTNRSYLATLCCSLNPGSVSEVLKIADLLLQRDIIFDKQTSQDVLIVLLGKYGPCRDAVLKLLRMFMGRGMIVDGQRISNNIYIDQDMVNLMLENKVYIEIGNVIRSVHSMEIRTWSGKLIWENNIIATLKLLLDHGSDPRSYKHWVDSSSILTEFFGKNYVRPKLSGEMLRRYERGQILCLLCMYKFAEEDNVLIMMPPELIFLFIESLTKIVF